MDNRNEVKELIKSVLVELLQERQLPSSILATQNYTQVSANQNGYSTVAVGVGGAVQNNTIVPTQLETGVFATVDDAIREAKRAQKEYEECSLATRDKVIKAIRGAMRPLVNELAERTLAETGMGRVADKVLKLNLAIDKTPGVEDLITECETGDNGMTLYELSAYGVIGAITPSTNPAETLICNSIGMLAAGNAIFFSVHPGAKNLSRWLVSEINKVIYETIGIQSLVVTLEEPSIESAQEMMMHPDISLLVVTGGPGVVNQALRSGKKVIGAGAGNPPAFVDETADIKKAAQDIVLGASLDNNILCIAEKSVVAIQSIQDELIREMVNVGCRYIDSPSDIVRLQQLTVNPDGTPNKKFIGKNASVILDAASISYTGDPRLIILKAPRNHPFAVIEMLMPILPVVAVSNFEEGLDVCLALENGLHHTATMHSLNMERLNRMARKMKTSIFVKNGPSYAGLGFNGEGSATFTIATPTGESTTTARCFARRRRCCLTTGFNIR